MDVVWLAVITQCVRSFALPAALRFMETWLCFHTLALPRAEREEKRSHARAHYHDLVEDRREEGYDPPGIAPYVVLDVLRGAPADVLHVGSSVSIRLGERIREWFGRAQFWLAILAVLAVLGLRRIPRFKSQPEPSAQWPLDWAVFAVILVMIALYSGALKRAPAEIAKWQRPGRAGDGTAPPGPIMSR